MGVVLLILAVALAMTPFRDGGVRCGPPLFGADASLSVPPSEEFGPLIVAYGCTDKAVGRLVLAGAFVVPGIVLSAVGVWLRCRPGSSSWGVVDRSRRLAGSQRP